MQGKSWHSKLQKLQKSIRPKQLSETQLLKRVGVAKGEEVGLTMLPDATLDAHSA